MESIDRSLSRIPAGGEKTVALCLALAAYAVMTARAEAQTELRLIVADSVTAQPIPGALIQLATAEGKRVWNGAAGRDGRATVRVAPGEMTLVAMMLGYRPVGPSAFIAPDQDYISVRILMSPAPLALDSIAVLARRRMPGPLDRRGFDWRREHSAFGLFVTEHELGTKVTVSLSSILRTMTGVRVESQAVGPPLVFMRGSTVISVDGYAVTCGPSVFRDGMLIHDGGSGVPIDDLVPVSDVKAIEIYRNAAEVPAEFERGPGSCGAIIVWTR